MGIKLDKRAAEKGVYGITVSFFDSAGVAATPKTLVWSLTDMAGMIINNRKDVAIPEPASTETIVLRDDDLQITDSSKSKEFRLLIVSATYDDAVLGADCPLREEIRFVVENQTEAA